MYENCVELLGRDFYNRQWIPNAMYRVYNHPENFDAYFGEADDLGVSLGGFDLMLEGTTGFGTYLGLSSELLADEDTKVEFLFSSGKRVTVPLAGAA